MPDELDEFLDLVGGEPAGSGALLDLPTREDTLGPSPSSLRACPDQRPRQCSRLPGNCDYCGTGSVARCNCGRDPLTFRGWTVLDSKATFDRKP
jgi:hypothetical protein